MVSEVRSGTTSALDRPAQVLEMATILNTLIQAGLKLQANPWYANEAAKVRSLLGGSKITIQQLINSLRDGTPGNYSDPGMNKVALEIIQT